MMNDVELARAIEEIYRRQGTAVLITVMEAGAPGLIGTKALLESPERPLFMSQMLSAWLDARPRLKRELLEAAAAFAHEERTSITSIRLGEGEEGIRVMLEGIRPEPQLIICGAGHIGQVLAPMARWLDFQVVVVDDRADYASRELFPDESIRLIVKPFAEALAALQITPSTSIVIVTRGHKYDEDCLRVLIHSPARYIGMIGSRRRVITVFRRLLEEGIPREAIERVHAPIGLDIGARTPAEIAVSILAEIVLTKYGGSGAPKRREIEPAWSKIADG